MIQVIQSDQLDFAETLVQLKQGTLNLKQTEKQELEMYYLRIFWKFKLFNDVFFFFSSL